MPAASEKTFPTTAKGFFTCPKRLMVDDGRGKRLQLCPTIFISDNSKLPDAVQYVYSRIAATSEDRITSGHPNLLLSLVGTGNSFNFQASEKLRRGLCRLLSKSCVWLVSSGERCDPMAFTVAAALKSTLPEREMQEEDLLLVVNSARVAEQPSSDPKSLPVMADSKHNTLYLLHENPRLSDSELMRFKTFATVLLANPPPALPLSPDALSFIERTPLPAVVFAGANLTSLLELRTYLELGIPALVIQDASSLCSIIRRSYLLFSSSSFEHERFMDWLDEELRLAGWNVVGEVGAAKSDIRRILASSSSDRNLITFAKGESLEALPEILLEFFMQNAVDDSAVRRVVHLAVKLDIPSLIENIDIHTALSKEHLEHVLDEALVDDGKVKALSALLDQNIPLNVTPQTLMRWYRRTTDQYFFNVVILGHSLGKDHIHESLDTQLASQLNDLLHFLAGGIDGLFPPTFFISPTPHHDRGTSLKMLAVWALLLCRTELAECFCAYTPEPTAFSLILAKVAKNLAAKCHDWFFYEERLRGLGRKLRANASAVLRIAYEETPDESYNALCRQTEYNGLTLTQLAFETNAKEFVSHECCQRWVLRLLYGDLQMRSASLSIRLPNWIKIVLSALFVFPSLYWVTQRPTDVRHTQNPSLIARIATPALTLFDIMRKPLRMKRAGSFHSVDDRHGLSSKKQLSLDDKVSLQDEPASVHISNGVEKVTPVSKPRAPKLTRMRRVESVISDLRAVDKLRLFYTTPITKYWISLVFRLIYILLIGYVIARPSCGMTPSEILVWLFSLSWLLESTYVFSVRLRYSHWRQLHWTLFDICVMTAFLIVILLGHIYNLAFFRALSTPYTAKNVWTAFLLYQCYSTLFIYVPLSDLFGPLMVRLKLMITRDFVNFIVLISLFVFSSAIAVQAAVYPDKRSTLGVLGESFSWAWLQMFTTDFSPLKPTEQCQKKLLPFERDRCYSMGGYSDPTCPTQSFMGYFTVLEHMVIIKLISFPILFALFADTADAVKEKAQNIWKYQMYSLATEFSLRPFLPPPFTFFFFFFAIHARLRGQISTMFYRATGAHDEHPDVRKVSKYERGNAGTAASLLPITTEKHYWVQLSIDCWKSNSGLKPQDSACEVAVSAIRQEMSDHFEALSMANEFCQRSGHSISRMKSTEDKSQRLHVTHELKPWDVLYPRYRPPMCSKPAGEFPEELREAVESSSSASLVETGKKWRQQRLSAMLSNGEKTNAFKLCSCGLPLNPAGRTGLAGRGVYPKFGPNIRDVFVITCSNEAEESMVIATEQLELPSRWHSESPASEEFLRLLLKDIGAPETLTPQRLRLERQGSEDDTDNAWLEVEVYHVELRGNFANRHMHGYRWVRADAEQLSLAAKTVLSHCLRVDTVD